MKAPRITAARAVGDRTLVIEFDNQEVKEYDVSQLFSRPMFAPLKNPSFFKNFSLEPGGYGIVWNEDIDISEYELWVNGVMRGASLDPEALSFVDCKHEGTDI